MDIFLMGMLDETSVHPVTVKLHQARQWTTLRPDRDDDLTHHQRFVPLRTSPMLLEMMILPTATRAVKPVVESLGATCFISFGLDAYPALVEKRPRHGVFPVGRTQSAIHHRDIRKSV